MNIVVLLKQKHTSGDNEVHLPSWRNKINASHDSKLLFHESCGIAKKKLITGRNKKLKFNVIILSLVAASILSAIFSHITQNVVKVRKKIKFNLFELLVLKPLRAFFCDAAK